MASLLCRRMWKQSTVGRLLNTAVHRKNITAPQARSACLLMSPCNTPGVVPGSKVEPSSVATKGNKLNILSRAKASSLLSSEKSTLLDSLIFTKHPSLSPLECRLTLQYYLPSSLPSVLPEITITDPGGKTVYELPVESQTEVEERQPTGAPDFIGDTAKEEVKQCRNDLWRRRRKMNKHKLKKLKKRMKFVLRRKRMKKIKKKALRLKGRIEDLYRKFGMTPPDNIEEQCNKVYPTIRA